MPSDDAVSHSHLHYVLGTTIHLTDVVVVGVALYIISMSLSNFLYWSFRESTPMEQAGWFLLIGSLLFLFSRAVSYMLGFTRRVIERWEATAREINGDGLPWLQSWLLAGIDWTRNVPHKPLSLADIYVHRPHAVPRSLHVEPSRSTEGEEEEDKVELARVSSVQSINTSREGTQKKPQQARY